VHDRTALGTADVDDAHLAALVAAALDVDTVELLASHAEVVAYDIEALTTAGRYRVTGRARHVGGEAGFTFFVKVLQSWGRTAAFRFVPEPLREKALAGLPFEAEARVYRSDLADRLPPGLAMPRAHAVVDIDDESTALWLEDIPIVPGRWDRDGLVRAAHLLGRLAASPRVRPLATVADPSQCRTPRMYAEGRLALQVVPALHDAEIWRQRWLPRPSTAPCAATSSPLPPPCLRSSTSWRRCRTGSRTATPAPATCWWRPTARSSCWSTSASGGRPRSGSTSAS
jgi:hypothetical protein